MWCREMEAAYIRFPTISDIQYTAASLGETFASEFLSSFDVLNVVSKSLPVLIEFYDLIHKELAYRIGVDVANELSIEKLLHQMKNHFSIEETRHFRQKFKEYEGIAIIKIREPNFFHTLYDGSTIVISHPIAKLV